MEQNLQLVAKVKPTTAKMKVSPFRIIFKQQLSILTDGKLQLGSGLLSSLKKILPVAPCEGVSCLKYLDCFQGRIRGR